MEILRFSDEFINIFFYLFYIGISITVIIHQEKIEVERDREQHVLNPAGRIMRHTEEDPDLQRGTANPATVVAGMRTLHLAKQEVRK